MMRERETSFAPACRALPHPSRPTNTSTTQDKNTDEGRGTAEGVCGGERGYGR